MRKQSKETEQPATQNALQVLLAKPVEIQLTEDAALLVRPGTVGELAETPAEVLAALGGAAQDGRGLALVLGYALEHFCEGKGLPCAPKDLPYEALAPHAAEVIGATGLFRYGIASASFTREIGAITRGEASADATAGEGGQTT